MKEEGKGDNKWRKRGKKLMNGGRGENGGGYY